MTLYPGMEVGTEMSRVEELYDLEIYCLAAIAAIAAIARLQPDHRVMACEHKCAVHAKLWESGLRGVPYGWAREHSAYGPTDNGGESTPKGGGSAYCR